MSSELASERIENAKQAMSETHISWESRCHAIMAALGIDYGRMDEFVPDDDDKDKDAAANTINPSQALKHAVGYSQAQWAKKHGISQAYVSDVINGRRDPGKAILEALGLERVVSYREKAQ